MLLPWGSLLQAVAGAEPDGLARLRGLCAPGAEVEVVVSEGDLDGRAPEELRRRYAAADLEIAVRVAAAAEVAALGTTWAKRLARSDPERRFRRLSGVVTAIPASMVPASSGGGGPSGSSRPRAPRRNSLRRPVSDGEPVSSSGR